METGARFQQAAIDIQVPVTGGRIPGKAQAVQFAIHQVPVIHAAQVQCRHTIQQYAGGAIVDKHQQKRVLVSGSGIADQRVEIGDLVDRELEIHREAGQSAQYRAGVRIDQVGIVAAVLIQLDTAGQVGRRRPRLRMQNADVASG